ncbi:uncharacterized protein LOC121380623 [Gigantopelta aegis]|uniref:uncharacterized protein LOC121380623 n=1 Tax=Gigantopelta aegis TaxID=1735272 RepID=UPI001B88B74F|nr:uncharacterized protein LOC121380623 [Gigantopelta aegis]
MPDNLKQPLGPIVLSSVSQDSYTVCWVKPNLSGAVNNFRGFLIESSSDNVKWTKTAEIDKALTSFTIEKYNKNTSQFVRVSCRYDGGTSCPLTSCDLKNVISAKVGSLNSQKNAPRKQSELLQKGSASNDKNSSAQINTAGSKPSGASSNKQTEQSVSKVKAPNQPEKLMSITPTKASSQVNTSKVMPIKTGEKLTSANAIKTDGLKSPEKKLPNVNAIKQEKSGGMNTSPATKQSQNASKLTPASSTDTSTKPKGGLSPNPGSSSTKPAGSTPSPKGGLLPTPTQRITPHKASLLQMSGSTQPAKPRGPVSSLLQDIDQPLTAQTNETQNSKTDILHKPCGPLVVSSVSGNSYTVSWVQPQQAGWKIGFKGFLVELGSDNISWTKAKQTDMTKTTCTFENYDRSKSQFVRVSCQYADGVSSPLVSCDLKNVIAAKAQSLQSQSILKGSKRPTPTPLIPSLTSSAPTQEMQKPNPATTVKSNLKKPCGPLLVVSASSDKFSVKWCNPSPPSPNLKGFVVERSTNNSSWTKVSELTKSVTMCTVTGCGVGDGQFVRVFAQYDIGRSEPLVSCNLVNVIAAKVSAKQAPSQSTSDARKPMTPAGNQSSFQQNMSQPVGSLNSRMKPPTSTNDKGQAFSAVDRSLKDNRPGLQRLGPSTVLCKHFPDCNQKPCRFYHPPCPNRNCTVRNCQYSHDNRPADFEDAKKPVDANTKGNQNTILCRHFPNCRYGDSCMFLHPTCSSLPDSRKPGCVFSHKTEGSHSGGGGFQMRRSAEESKRLTHLESSGQKFPPPSRSTPRHEDAMWTDNMQRSDDRSDSFKKVPCKYWPNCQRGKRCPFIHPDEKCPDGPHCRKGASCTLIHPQAGSKRYAPPASELSAPAPKIARSERDGYSSWQFEENVTGYPSARDPYEARGYRRADEYGAQDRYGRGRAGEVADKGQLGETASRGRMGEVAGRGRMGEVAGRGRMGEMAGRGRMGEMAGRGRMGEVAGRGRMGEVAGRYQETQTERRLVDDQAGSRMYGNLTRSAKGADPRGYSTEAAVQEVYGYDRWVDASDYDQFGDKWDQREIFDYSERKSKETSAREPARQQQQQQQRMYSTQYPQLHEYPPRASSDQRHKELQADTQRRSQATDPWRDSGDQRLDTRLDKPKPLMSKAQAEWLGYDDPAYYAQNKRRDPSSSARDDDLLAYKQHNVYGQEQAVASRRSADSRLAEPSDKYTYEESMYRAPGVAGTRAESRATVAEDEWAAYDQSLYGQSGSSARSQHAAASRKAKLDDELAYSQSVYGSSADPARRRNPVADAADKEAWAYSEAAYGQSRALPPVRREPVPSADKYRQDERSYAGDHRYKETYAAKQEAYPYPLAYDSEPTRDEAKRRPADVYERDPYAYSYPQAGVESWN